ncbi:ribonuclease H-like domain-containing protein [Tanacetum coccineum]
MQKVVLKQQFEAFTIPSSEGLEKGYDRFQQLLSLLEAHGAEVSTKDANHKFLRSLPPTWSNLAMTMRTKPDDDTLSIDDLYNNLRVFEQELTSTSKSSASAQNVAFVSHSKSNTNKVKSGHTVIYSLFVKQSEDLDLLHEDLEQIDDLDIEEMDINWQIAMIAIRMKKFYKKTRRRVRIDGNKPVGFDKKKLECFKCHNTGHFARECTSKGTNDGKKRDSFYQDQGAGKKEQNQNCLLTMDDGVVNWGEHTVEEVETNHALMAISSNNEVSLCSKTCIDSYNKLKTLCDEQTNQLGEQEAKILAYNQAVKKLEAQIVTFQKQQLSLNEQLTFQANELYEKDEKLKKYRRIGMKAVKEKEQLQKTVDSWKDSSKNLWKLVNSGMSSNSKVGLGYGIKSNNEVLSYEEEMNHTVFNCTEEDFVAKPLYNRFSKTDNLKGGPQKPETSVSDDTFSENSVTTNEKVVSEPKPKEVEPSCVTHVKTPRQPMKNQGTPKVNGKNWNEMMERELGEGYSFIKKKCFVCGSLSHLIRNCDFYEKKMAREAELKKQRVFNTGNGVAKPVWNNANRVNHANHFVPRPVQLIAVRQNVNSVRPNVNTGMVNVNSVRQNVNSVRSNVNTSSFNINTVKAKQPINTSNSNSFSPVRPQDHPLKNMKDKGIFDSGCSGHMTGNKDHLDDFEECKGGSVTFGGSKGYITGKGRIKHKVLFTETECLVVSPDFKMPDENQILRKVPRQHNMYSFDMKIHAPTKDYTCLIAKATSDESKLWHRRLGTSEVTNSACTLQTPSANASEEEDEAEELIILQNLKTQEKEAYSTRISEDTPEILAFRRELDDLAQKHLREVPKNKATSTTSVNSGSGPVIINMLEEPKKISEALKDDSWVEAMQEELLQFRLQQVWILVDLPHGAKVIGTKWVYRNKRDERGVVVRNKARLVAQGHRQEEGID